LSFLAGEPNAGLENLICMPPQRRLAAINQMTVAENPALEAFIRELGTEKVWGEVLIRREGEGFLLCHESDREVRRSELRRVLLGDIRKLAMFTAKGQFRPLHASPDLVRGWLLECKDSRELWRGLQELYPGSVPDWFSIQAGNPPVTDYREFTNRQTGMYRITQLLTDTQAANVVRAGCHSRFCLKRRMWTVGGLEPDMPGVKSEMPCLEPCAVLLELARKAARIEQEEKIPVQIGSSELESFLVAVEKAIAASPESDRVGNIGSAGNPRRLQLLLEKFKQEKSAASKTESEE
jgi:hypothetical protein